MNASAPGDAAAEDAGSRPDADRDPDPGPGLTGAAAGVAGLAGLGAVAVHLHHGDEAQPETDAVEPVASAGKGPAEPDAAEHDAAEPAAAEHDVVEPDAVGQAAAEPGAVGQDATPARRDPAEQAAAHDPVDVALLRTFGVADPGTKADEAAIVSLAGVGDRRAGAVPAHGGPPVAVVVRVVDRGHAGVAGATVTLVDDRGRDAASARSDGDGRAEFTAPGPGTYMLVSSAPGHQPGACGVVVGEGPVEAEVLLARSSSVRGSVWGPDGAAAGARVTLVQDGEEVDSVETGADGGYRISDLPAGSYGLSVTAPGCEPLTTVLAVVDATDARHDIDLEAARLADLS